MSFTNMNSFLNSMRSVSSSKEGLVRKSIITQLSESVKEIQLCGLDESISGDSMDIGDASNNLCSIVEAMFLHGLKDSLMHKARRVIGNDIDQRPEPSFLSPLLIYSHRQIIEQISSLPHITTEIGQCRAWIRISLNDCLLSSYLSLMTNDSKPLVQFYKQYAFLRDTDTLDVARKLIESVEMCNNFTLPCNSSLLNIWPLPTLLLAGIWSPPLRRCPISSGIDVAQSLENSSYLKPSSDISSQETLSLTSQGSEFGKMLAMNEDDALKIILANTKQTIPNNNFPPTNQNKTIDKQRENISDFSQPCSSSETQSFDSPEKTEATIEETTTLGNSLNRHSEKSGAPMNFASIMFGVTDAQIGKEKQMNPNQWLSLVGLQANNIFT